MRALARDDERCRARRLGLVDVINIGRDDNYQERNDGEQIDLPRVVIMGG